MKLINVAVLCSFLIPTIAFADDKTFKGIGPDGKPMDYLWYEELANCAGQFQAIIQLLPKLDLSNHIDNFAQGEKVFEANAAKRIEIDWNYSKEKAKDHAKIASDTARIAFIMQYNQVILGYFAKNNVALPKEGQIEILDSRRAMCDGLIQDYQRLFPNDLAKD